VRYDGRDLFLSVRKLAFLVVAAVRLNVINLRAKLFFNASLSIFNLLIKNYKVLNKILTLILH
jgi:hypothetical protein